MKSILKKGSAIFAVVLVAAVFIIGANQISAVTAPNSISVKRTIVLNDIVTNHDHGFTIFNTSDSKYIYCLDVDKKPLVTGQQATLAGNGDAGLLYLLQNGYPNKEITGNDNIDMYITQAAVWWYMDETGQGGKMSNEFKNATTTDVYGAIPKYIKPMVAKAKTAKDTQAKPSMKVTSNGTTLVLTSDGKYYESNLMSASLVGAKTYNATVTGGTKNTTIVDEKGNAKNTFNSSERFKVRMLASEVTKETKVTVQFAATGSIQKAKIYKPSDAAFQRVVGLYDEETPLAQNVGLTVNPKQPDKHVCEFKDDKYYGKNGNVVDKDTYVKECGTTPNYHVCEFIDNKYYGKDGNIVDQKTFNSECGQVIVVPNTSSNIPAAGIVIGLLAIVGGAGIIAYRKKNILS